MAANATANSKGETATRVASKLQADCWQNSKPQTGNVNVVSVVNVPVSVSGSGSIAVVCSCCVIWPSQLVSFDASQSNETAQYAFRAEIVSYIQKRRHYQRTASLQSLCKALSCFVLSCLVLSWLVCLVGCKSARLAQCVAWPSELKSDFRACRTQQKQSPNAINANPKPCSRDSQALRPLPANSAARFEAPANCDDSSAIAIWFRIARRLLRWAHQVKSIL